MDLNGFLNVTVADVNCGVITQMIYELTVLKICLGKVEISYVEWPNL